MTYQINLDDLARDSAIKGRGILFCGHLGRSRLAASYFSKPLVYSGDIRLKLHVKDQQRCRLQASSVDLH